MMAAKTATTERSEMVWRVATAMAAKALMQERHLKSNSSGKGSIDGKGSNGSTQQQLGWNNDSDRMTRTMEQRQRTRVMEQRQQRNGGSDRTMAATK